MQTYKIWRTVSRESPDMILWLFLEKGAWPGSRDPQFFWALNAYTGSKTVKDTDFKFHAHVSRDIPDIIR